MNSRKMFLAIFIMFVLSVSGCTGNINNAGKQVHDEQCRVERDSCDSLCNQQPDTEQAGCKAKCDSDYYTCESSN